MWREILSRALVPIALSVLSGLVYQSGKYYFVDLATEIEQVENDTSALGEKTAQQTAEQKAFTEIQNGYLEKEEKRNSFLQVVAHRGIYRASSSIAETHLMALNSLVEINDQLGQISGYSHFVSLYSGIHAALINVLTAEASAWEVIRKHTAQNRNRQEDSIAEEELSLAIVQMVKSTSFFRSANKEFVSWGDAQDRENKRQDHIVEQRLQHFEAWRNIARRTFVASTLGWLVLLVYLVYPVKEKPLPHAKC